MTAHAPDSRRAGPGASAGLLAIAVFAVALLASVGPVAAQEPPVAEPDPPVQESEADRQFSFAEGLLVRGFADLAADEYRDFLARWPDDERAPTARFRLGEALEAAGRAEEAVDAFRAAAEAAGDHRAAALYRAARLMPDLGRPGDAEPLLRELLTGGPDGGPLDPALVPAARRLRGEALLAAARQAEGAERSALREQGIAALEEVVAGGDPEHAPRAAMTLAEDAVERGDREAAAERLRGVVERHGNSEIGVQARLRLGEVLLDAGRPDAAAAALEPLADAGGRPGRRARYRLAWARYAQERHDDCLALLEPLLLDRGGGEAVEDPAVAAGALYLAGLADLALGSSERAAERFSRVLKAFPDAEVAARARARRPAALVGALEQVTGDDEAAAARRADLLDRVEQACTALREAADGPAAAAEADWHQGRALLAVGRGTEGLDLLQRAGESAAPDVLPHVRFDLGRALRAADRPTDAAAAFAGAARAAEALPGDRGAAVRSAALYEAARARESGADWTGAARDYAAFLEAERARGDRARADMLRAAERRLGVALVVLDRHAEAIERLRPHAAPLVDADDPAAAPDDAREAAYWLGVALQELDRPGEAADLFDMVVRAEAAGAGAGDADRLANARRRLARCLFDAGRELESARVFAAIVTGGGDAGDLTDKVLFWAADRLRRGAEGERDRTDALAVLDALDSAHPGSDLRPLGRLLRVRLLRELGRADAALVEAEALAAEASGETAEQAAVEQAELLLATDRTDEAAAVVERLAGSVRPAVQVRVRMVAAELAWRAGDREAAAREWLRVAILYDDPERSPEALARAAAAMEDLERPGRAADLRRELRERYPDSPQARALDAGDGDGDDEDDGGTPEDE